MARQKPPAIKISSSSINEDTEMSYSWNTKLSGEILKKFLKIRGNKKNSDAVKAIILDFYNKLSSEQRKEYWKVYKTANQEAGIDISVFDRVCKDL